MRWSRADVRATTLSVLLQIATAMVLAAFVGAIWSRFDGRTLLTRWSDAMLIAGPLWLLGSGTYAAKTTTLSYMQWGIRERNATLYGDDIGTSDLGVLTSFGEAIVVGIALITLATLLG